MRVWFGRRLRLSARSIDHLRPGARAVVLGLAFVIVLGSSLATATIVAQDMTHTAVGEASKSAETVVRGYVDPLLSGGVMSDPSGPQGAQINAQLERLVGTGGLLRLKIWAPDGRVLFSDLPLLRGARFPVDEDLAAALGGQAATDITAPDQAENVFERGLASTVLEIYLPIRSGNEVAGTYEVYEDAAPILAAVSDTQRRVFAIALGVAALILLLLYAAFAGTWARLLRANRSLRRLTGDVRHSEARFRSLVQNSADIVSVLDARGLVTYDSVAATHVLGYPSARTGESLFDYVHPDDVAWTRAVLAEVVARRRSQRSAEPRVRHADGSWRVMEWTLTNALDDPAIGGVVLNSRDISERRELEDQLRHQALHDPLTGLANRALFADRIEHALARRDGGHRGIAVLFLDLDDFKTINDSLGHGMGDQLLVAVADRLRATLRPADTVARLGGDEFGVLIDEPVTAGAPEGVAERILDALAEPVLFGQRAVAVRASIGIAWSDGRRSRAADLLRDADVAMYAAKRRGKARYEIFETGMRTAALARLELKSDLDRALVDGELVLHYQPIVDLRDGRIRSVEALARWNHPVRGLLAPEWFIRLAEDTGQIVPLGRWVVAEACRQAGVWRRELDREVGVAVNLSARELQDPGLVDHVRGQLASNGMAPGALTVEITESAWVEEAETSGRALDALRRLGVHLAIDDFGIGYSSLGYLQRFPFDSLKIDRSFVAGLGSDQGGEPLVRSIVELGRRLEREVVAEGIETVAQLLALRRLDCWFGQGQFLARPQPPDALRDVMRTGVVTVAEMARPTPRASSRRGGTANGKARIHEDGGPAREADEPTITTGAGR